MENQMTIWDILAPDEETKFCDDDDINVIVEMLDEISDRHGLEHEAEYRIWAHVPQFGYRLSYSMKVHRDTEISDEIESVVRFADSRNIELSPMWGSTFFYDDNEADFRIYSLFKDKRQKRK